MEDDSSFIKTGYLIWLEVNQVNLLMEDASSIMWKLEVKNGNEDDNTFTWKLEAKSGRELTSSWKTTAVLCTICSNITLKDSC